MSIQNAITSAIGQSAIGRYARKDMDAKIATEKEATQGQATLAAEEKAYGQYMEILSGPVEGMKEKLIAHDPQYTDVADEIIGGVMDARKEEYEKLQKQMKEKDSTIFSHSKSELQLAIAQTNKESQNLKRNQHIQGIKAKRGIR